MIVSEKGSPGGLPFVFLKGRIKPKKTKKEN